MTNRALLPIAILLAGLVTAALLVMTRPQAERAEVQETTTRVDVSRARKTREPIRVSAHGTVQPAREVTLRPEVSGPVVWQSERLVPGGRFRAGEKLLRIDPRAYELAVEAHKADVARAEVELELEKGRQEVARHELELFREELSGRARSEALVLRKPQMENARATLEAARSDLARAELDLERTTLRAPFDAIVLEESVDSGQRVTPQTTIARLAGTDRFWVQVQVPASHLRWIEIPGVNSPEGSLARVTAEPAFGLPVEREGSVLQLLGDLDPAGRMARILVGIDDPLRLEEENYGPLPLLVNAYVDVTIHGKEIDDVFRVPRVALREGNEVWVVDDEDRLAFRPVDVVHRTERSVLVRSGLEDGDRIVLSRVATAVPGMKVVVDGTSPAVTEPSVSGEDASRSRPVPEDQA